MHQMTKGICQSARREKKQVTSSKRDADITGLCRFNQKG